MKTLVYVAESGGEINERRIARTIPTGDINQVVKQRSLIFERLSPRFDADQRNHQQGRDSFDSLVGGFPSRIPIRRGRPIKFLPPFGQRLVRRTTDFLY